MLWLIPTNGDQTSLPENVLPDGSSLWPRRKWKKRTEGSVLDTFIAKGSHADLADRQARGVVHFSSRKRVHRWPGGEKDQLEYENFLKRRDTRVFHVRSWPDELKEQRLEYGVVNTDMAVAETSEERRLSISKGSFYIHAKCFEPLSRRNSRSTLDTFYGWLDEVYCIIIYYNNLHNIIFSLEMKYWIKL